MKDVSQFLCLKIGDRSGTNEFLTLPEFQTHLLFVGAALVFIVISEVVQAKRVVIKSKFKMLHLFSKKSCL